MTSDRERIDELVRMVADLTAKVDLLVRHNVPKVRCADDGGRNPYCVPSSDKRRFHVVPTPQGDMYMREDLL